jgi:hypothetical protein
MEHGLVRIPSPAFSVGGVSTEHMIVGQEVLVAEVLGGLSVVSDGFRVGTYLTLWESHTYLHTQPPFSNSSRIHKGVIQTVLMAAAFSGFAYEVSPSVFWNWLGTLLATFISVLAAVGVGLRPVEKVGREPLVTAIRTRKAPKPAYRARDTEPKRVYLGAFPTGRGPLPRASRRIRASRSAQTGMMAEWTPTIDRRT